MRALGALYAVVCIVASSACAQAPACDALFAEAQAASARFLDDSNRNHLRTVLEQSREARACFGSEHPDQQAETFNYEVYALHSLQRFDEAQTVLETFFDAFPAVQDSALWAKMYQRSGYVAFRTGRFAEAQQEYARAVRYASALPLWRRTDLYLLQATGFDLMGDDVRALALYEHVVELLRGPAETDPALRSMLGRTLHQIADVLMAQRSPSVVPRAVAMARESLRLLDAPDRETARQRVFAISHLAEALAASGERGEALTLRQQAVQAADAHGDLMLRMQAWYYLGNARLNRGEPDAALAALQHGLDLALQYGEPSQERRLLSAIGEAYEAKGLPDEAASYYRQAIDKAELHRASLGTTSWAATAFATWQGPYRRLALLHLAEGRPEQAFTLLEQTRARYLHDLRRTGRDLARLDDEERIRLRRLESEIERLRTVLLDSPRNAATIRNQLAELEVERYGTTDSLAYTPPKPADVQRALEPHEVVLSYFLDDLGSHLFVVTREAFHAVPLEVTAPQIDSLVYALSPLWQNTEDAPSRRSAEFEVGPLHTLYEALVAPVRSLLPPEASLIIIPEGRLVQVPFAMLLEAPTRRFQYADAPFLVRRFPVTTEQAAVLLTESAGRGGEADLDLLALGRSEFPSPASELRDGTDVLYDLPVVEDEINALRDLVPSGFFALNDEASESVLAHRIGRARVVHLASHATVNEVEPLYSHIELWPDSAQADDGRLHLYEVVGQSLAASLVVLSGCSTARGEVLPGEGMKGLQYAFRSAGADASVATLWHVDDAASGRLMERFYVHLRRGLTKDRALQRAQLDYLDGARGIWASPFYWAAPVLYGDTAPVGWKERSVFPPVGWVGLGIVLLLLALSLPRFARLRS